MKAQIITIGDEILIGQTIDTNSAWMGTRLNEMGYLVDKITTISDDREAIETHVKWALGSCNLLILTGGLGPTRDDITKVTLCELFGGKLIRNQEVEERIVSFFTKLNRPVLEVNRMQADLPSNCTMLPNLLGTAPGMLWEIDGTTVVSMPGVPYEMKKIFSDQLVPYLQSNKTSEIIVRHKNLLTVGIGESSLAEEIKDIEDDIYNSGFRLAYLPNPGSVKLRISYNGKENPESVEQRLNQFAKRIATRVAQYYVGEGEKAITKLIGKQLVAHQLTVGVVESCSGGYIAHQFTKEEGCSQYFKGGMVVYSNELKEKLIGVDAHAIKEFGAVSESVAEQLAEKGRIKLGVDYCIATTGVAGPTGGTNEKPVGLVYTSVSGPQGTRVFKNNYGGTRNRIVERASIGLLNELLKMLQSDIA
ncbi:competence/damage-inducible protein A [Luteibaculum oceani]|uniref:CinA-like protein n=1 Tax=Luteibaculum oceani TaxID=1294296 RepID=A0A5C6VFC2_9FLAO|nr:competence/damage-inducible protein A [Luteibaculum oceani]TXC81978.1 competence/damage-inducible protein A [Luteibaculum oceani]